MGQHTVSMLLGSALGIGHSLFPVPARPGAPLRTAPTAQLGPCRAPMSPAGNGQQQAQRQRLWGSARAMRNAARERRHKPCRALVVTRSTFPRAARSVLHSGATDFDRDGSPDDRDDDARRTLQGQGASLAPALGTAQGDQTCSGVTIATERQRRARRLEQDETSSTRRPPPPIGAGRDGAVCIHERQVRTLSAWEADICEDAASRVWADPHPPLSIPFAVSRAMTFPFASATRPVYQRHLPDSPQETAGASGQHTRLSSLDHGSLLARHAGSRSQSASIDSNGIGDLPFVARSGLAHRRTNTPVYRPRAPLYDIPSSDLAGRVARARQGRWLVVISPGDEFHLDDGGSLAVLQNTVRLRCPVELSQADKTLCLSALVPAVQLAQLVSL